MPNCKNDYRLTLAHAAGDELFFENEACSFYGHGADATPYDVRLGGGHKESRLVDEAATQKVAQYVLDSLRSWRVYHFHDTSSSAAVKQKQAIDDNSALRPNASNLAAFLLRLRSTSNSAYRRIVASIRLVAPFFEDFVLRPDPAQPAKIQLEWQERGSDAYFNANTMSDGTLRFVCLSTLMLQPELPSVILIDEPELGLHPYAVHQLAALIRSASTRTQVIVSTQSVTLMNQFGPDDIVVVDRKHGESLFRRLDRAEIAA